MDDGKREFALGQIFAKPLEGAVAGCRGEIKVVVEDLEEEADCRDERCAVAVIKSVWESRGWRMEGVHLRRALGLHEFDG
jgi:hypothetical protein